MSPERLDTPHQHPGAAPLTDSMTHRSSRLRPATSSASGALTLLLLGASLTACGGGAGENAAAARFASGVLHLDPRLADGRSPAAALAALRQDTAIYPTPSAPDLGPWELVGGVLGEAEGLLTVRSNGEDLTGNGQPRPARLVYRGALEARDVRALELGLRVEGRDRAAVRWQGSEGFHALTSVVRRLGDPRRVVFNLAKSPGWIGTIERLEIVLSASPSSVSRLSSLALLPYRFEWGGSPSEGGGDAGLRQRGLSMLRAWPADTGPALHAKLGSVPRSGRLAVSVARGNSSALQPFGLSVRVDGRRPGGRWEVLAAADLVQHSRLDALDWLPLVADLSPFAGGPLELRFSADGGDPRDPDDPAGMRESVLWGAPLVLGEPPPDPRPSVLLVTLDTTRADALGDGWTPNLSGLAAQGFAYTDAWSTANSTTLSHASILTGLPGVTHGAITNRHALPEQIVTLAERFRAAGYATAAAVSVPHIDPRTGFGQGFDRFAVVRAGAEVDGALTVEQVEQWFSEWSALPRAPRFLWVHLFDAHTPYGPPDAWVAATIEARGLEVPPMRVDPPSLPLWPSDGSRDRRQLDTGQGWLGRATNVEFVRFRYRLGVAYEDELLGRLLAGMERLVPRDELATLVTADHGEAIGEHGVWYDHAGLFRETLQVPLVLRPPARLGLSSAVVDAPASNADIAPTLLRLAGVAGAEQLEGRNLLDLEELGRPRAIYFAFSALRQEGFREADRHFVLNREDGMLFAVDLVQTEHGVVPVPRKPIPANRGFLYDTLNDPGLLHDLAGERPAEVAAARAKLEAWREPRRAEVVERRRVDDEEEAALRAMGYAGDD